MNLKPFAQLSAALLLIAPAFAEDPEAPAPIASKVTIVVRSEILDGEKRVIEEPASIAKLEALFPDYETLPKGGRAAGWAAMYTFDFLQPDGSTIKVNCDFLGDPWSAGVGNGDLRVNGNLKKTLRALK